MSRGCGERRDEERRRARKAEKVELKDEADLKGAQRAQGALRFFSRRVRTPPRAPPLLALHYRLTLIHYRLLHQPIPLTPAIRISPPPCNLQKHAPPRT